MQKMMLTMGWMSVALLGGGCVHFPYGQSLDRHNFVSTPLQPVTLTLLDTYTGQTVWTLDVPVNKTAVIDLDHPAHWTADQTPHTPATKIRWGIFDTGTTLGMLKEKQYLSGNPVLLKWSIRQGVEEFTPPGEKKVKEEEAKAAKKSAKEEKKEKPAEPKPAAG